MAVDALPAFRTDTDTTDWAVGVLLRSHALRTLGLSLGAIMVGVVFYRRGVPAPAWVLCAIYTLVWPHIAWWVLHHSRNPGLDGRHLALADAAMGGVWIALIQFNLLPSVLIVTMFAITLIAIGGSRFLARGISLQIVACGLAAIANGLAFAPSTDMPEMLASLPLLMAFPVSLGFITYGLTQQVHDQNDQLLRLGSTDVLSGLLNRRHWEGAVNAALLRRSCKRAVLLLIDIDRFKRINDGFGHTVGDEVIWQVGAIIRDCLRDDDLAGRYGGDEFGLVLCEADLAAAAAVAERVRDGVARMTIDRAPGLRCTLSIGVAGRSVAVCDARTWVDAADIALYQAKLAGRDRFIIAP